MNQEEIISNFNKKHNLSTPIEPSETLMELVRYAYSIGYNNGYNEFAKAHTIIIKRGE